MKFEAAASFRADLRRLSSEHHKLFLAVITAFNAACDAYAANPGSFVWPANLRVSRMVNHSGVWEMTWSFAGPDGRATFEFVRIDGELAVRWRRIGGHDIYRQP